MTRRFLPGLLIALGVLALKPDLILDVGSMNPTYISLADRVQQQTGIPYALLDGRFEGIPLSYRTLGALIGWREQGESLADQLLALGRDCAARLKEPIRSADHAALLYDEHGLP